MTPGVFQIVDKLIYISLFSLGCFFIYKGQVVEKFNWKRTNFAEHDEDLAEFPTISTFIDVPEQERSRFAFGRDFNISYGPSLENLTQLKLGENTIRGTPLKVDLEAIFHGNDYILTPMNFKPALGFSFYLVFDFRNSTAEDVSLRLSTENNTIPVGYPDGKYFDGDLDTTGMSPGETKVVNINPEKYKFLSSQTECREEPYTELFFQKLSNLIRQDCLKPCKPDISFGKRLNAMLGDLQICENKAELKCYEETVPKAKGSLTSKPCVKVDYKGLTTSSKNENENRAIGLLQFNDPPVIKVREEYLIYDIVSMISAIGGTMGLCIGISFYNVCGVLLGFLEHVIDWVKGNKDSSALLFRKSSKVTQHEDIQSLVKIKKELFEALSKEISVEVPREVSKELSKEFSNIKTKIIVLEKSLKKIQYPNYQ